MPITTAAPGKHLRFYLWEVTSFAVVLEIHYMKLITRQIRLKCYQLMGRGCKSLSERLVSTVRGIGGRVLPHAGPDCPDLPQESGISDFCRLSANSGS